MTWRARGTTLLEVIVTLAIMGIVTAITLPTFAAAATGRQADPSQLLTQVLRAARARALRAGTDVMVTVDPATGRYWIVAEEVPLAVGDLALPSGTTISATVLRLTLTFSATGAAAGDSVTVVNASGVVTLGADPWTGEVYAHAR